MELLLTKFLLYLHPTQAPIFLQEEIFHKPQRREGSPLWTQLPKHTAFRTPPAHYEIIFLIF